MQTEGVRELNAGEPVAGLRRLINEELHNLHPPSNTVKVANFMEQSHP
jgi:hypothetical protein